MRIFFLIMILLTMVGFNSETKSKSDTTFGPHEPLRFIAHAGGRIEGMNYTNSLEALNNSYKNGFRLFELDIIETSDGEFVAAHDWKHWKTMVGYPEIDNKPVSMREFKKYKIANLTSLGMNEINNWFLEHKDAILVTDKVNFPRKFSNIFIDKQRLMMELFTLEAVKEGLDANIFAAMPNGGLWQEIKKDKNLIKKIEYIAASHQNPYIPEIKEFNIKVYAFHLNHFGEKNQEIDFLCNKQDMFFGFYADDTNFLKQHTC